jgi:hypothetical protein
MPRQVLSAFQYVACLIVALSAGPVTAESTESDASAPAARPATPAPAAGAAAASAAAAAPAAPAPASAPTGAARTAEVPQFEQGMWEYRRTVRTKKPKVGDAPPEPEVSKRCGSPTSDIRQRLASLANQGCRNSPLVQRENHYEFTSVCSAANGVAVIHDVVTFLSSTGYQEDEDVMHAPQVTRSTTVATRVGECLPTAIPRSGRR